MPIVALHSGVVTRPRVAAKELVGSGAALPNRQCCFPFYYLYILTVEAFTSRKQKKSGETSIFNTTLLYYNNLDNSLAK